MSAIFTIGIDLAKNVFAVQGVDATGMPVLLLTGVARSKLLELIAAAAVPHWHGVVLWCGAAPDRASRQASHPR
jgi:hypothetical protein